MNFDAADSIEVAQPAIEWEPGRVQIVENRVAHANPYVSAVIRDGGTTSIIAKTHHEIASARPSDFNSLSPMSGSHQCLSSGLCAILAFQDLESMGSVRGNIRCARGRQKLISHFWSKSLWPRRLLQSIISSCAKKMPSARTQNLQKARDKQ